jgi:lipid-A-disaccharide synthase
MKVYIVAGEPSGDLHGSNLIKALQQQMPSVQLRFWGGELMSKSAGLAPVVHYRSMSFMGFIEVVKHLPSIYKLFNFCKKDITLFNPDVVVFIDYPGFNLRLAKWSKKNGYRTDYYISPKAWAWKKSRVHTLKKYVDRLFTIFPFETEFFRNFGYEVSYVGNPLMDEILHYRSLKSGFSLREHYGLGLKPIIAILPGSREQEVRTKLPLMLAAATSFSSYQIVIAGAPSLDAAFYNPFIVGFDVTLVFDATYSILESSECAIVTSGTATLETALLKIPQVVCYIASPISFAIAKRLITIKYISLVNLIFDEEVVKELVQSDCSVEKIKHELSLILSGGDKREFQLAKYNELQLLLGDGKTSEKVANQLISDYKLV